LLPENPEVILLPKTDSFSPSLEEFQSLPGWKDLTAVKEHRMFFVSESILRPGPRLVDALEELAGIFHPAAAIKTGERP
jgi:iron complex transport system substrate-binding protein